MSTYTPSLGLELITPGSQAGLWGNTTNNTFNLIDQAVTGVTPLSFASASGTTQVLTDYNGAEDQARAAVLNITGTATGPNTVVIPNKQKTYMVRNGTGQDITFQTPTATTPNIVAAGNNTLIFCDGNNGVFPGILVPGAGTLGVNGGGTGVTTFSAGFIKSPGGTTSLTSSPTVSLTTEVAGTLAVANGGTGKSSLASGALLFGNGTGAVGEFVGGAAGQVATWNGTGWTAASPSTGVSSVSSTTIGVSPTSGNVVITLTGSNITTALGITPVQYATNVAASGTIASSVTATTQATTDNSTLVATTAYVKNNLANYATTTSLSGYAQLTGASFSGAISATTGTFSTSVISPLHYAGTNTTNSAVLQPQSLNFYSSYTGNSVTSLLFNPTGSALASQAYYLSFNNSGSAAYNYAFYGDGTAQKIGGGTWSATSDARIKKDITPLLNALDVIDALNPVSFNWKYDRPYEATVGFIAQEVASVLPSAVRDVEPNEDEKRFVQEGEKIKTIGWQNDMIAYLVGAIKELKAEIDTLKAAK